jgi:hypothetical protein
MNKLKEAEFRGFFYADGCVSLHKRRVRNTYIKKDGSKPTNEWSTTHICRVQITQRKDNMKYLLELQETFGGQIYAENPVKNTAYVHRPTAYWSVQKIDLCKKVLEILLDTQFTYRSYDAVKAAHEFCTWKLDTGLNKKKSAEDHAYADKLEQRVKQAHKYKE